MDPNDPRARQAAELRAILEKVPMPLTVAQDLSEVLKRNSLDERTRVMAQVGILMFWLANEVNDLVIAFTMPEEEPTEGEE